MAKGKKKEVARSVDRAFITVVPRDVKAKATVLLVLAYLLLHALLLLLDFCDDFPKHSVPNLCSDSCTTILMCP